MHFYTKRFIGVSVFCALLVTGNSLFAQRDSTSTDSTVTKTVKPSFKGIAITGTIINGATNEPIDGVSVNAEGYTAAISNSTGKFTISIPNLNTMLTFSAPGFQQKQISVKGKTALTVILYETGFSSFYETLNLPTGQRTQTGTPFAVKAITIDQEGWENTNETPGSYLQGQVTGLSSVRKSGTPNIGTYMTLRGFNSLYATNEPLIVVDGVIYDNNDYSAELIKGHTNSSLGSIDLRDIDDITVLKDGSSIYGTKGANGVIMITTAHAKVLATRIDAAVYGGFNQAPKNLPVLNAAQFRVLATQMLQSRGFSAEQIQAQPYVSDDPSNPNYYKYHYDTNWQDEVLKNSYNKNYFLKVSGGDNIAKYVLSLGYLNNGGITDKTDLNRYNTRLNAELNLSKKLSAKANLSFVYNEQNLRDQGIAPKTNPIYAALIKAPFLGKFDVAANGTESPNFADRDTFGFSNPGVLIDNAVGKSKNYRFFGNVNFDYKFTNNLKLGTILGLTFDKVRENFFIPTLGVKPDTLAFAIAKNRSGSEIQRFYNIYTDTYLDYNKAYGYDHKFAARVGLRTQSNSAESDFGLGFNSATDDFISVGTGSNLLRQVGGSIGDWNWLNLYFGSNYSYKSKYFLSLNVAVDGSSRFGSEANTGINLGDNYFAVMPSLAGAWLLSSESFLADSKAIQYWKLRASFGYTGNDDIGNYTSRQYYISQNLLGVEGLVKGNIGNPNLHWETVRKINVGTDLSFFKEKVSLSLDAYANHTSDMIVYEPVNYTTGLSYAISNSGAMDTKGYEMALNTRVYQTKDFKVDLGLNLSTYKNKVTELPVNNIITQFGGASYITRVGQEANLFYGLQANGVYTTNAEASAAGLSKRAPNGSLIPYTGGDIKYTDRDNNKIIDDNDRMVIGNPNPDLFGMFSGSFTYKRLTFNSIFSFTTGNDLYNGTRASLEGLSGFENQSIAVLNRWSGDGHQTTIPKLAYGDPTGNAAFSSRWIEKGSYLKLRTVALSYDFPFKDKQIKYIRLYATGNNLFTATKYLGYDPEFSATSSIYGQGADIGLEPLYRTYQLGFRLGL